MLGYPSLSELYGQDVSEILYYYPGERGEILSGILREGSVTNYECTLKKRDDTPITVLVSSHTYYDASGNALGIEGIFRDISERKKGEIALKKSEDLYRTIFDMTGSGSIIIDENTTILLANSGFAELSGYSIQELEGKKSWNDFVVPEDLRRMNEYHYNRRNKPESAPRVYEFRFLSRHGEIRHCICNVGVIPGSVHSVASVVDITDRVLAEEAMKKSENQYRAFFENSCAPTIIIAPDMTILHANAGWVRLTGISRIQQENKKKWTDFADTEEVGKMMHYHWVRREDPDLAPQTYDCKVVDAEKKVHHCFVNVDLISPDPGVLSQARHNGGHTRENRLSIFSPDQVHDLSISEGSLPWSGIRSDPPIRAGSIRMKGEDANR